MSGGHSRVTIEIRTAPAYGFRYLRGVRRRQDVLAIVLAGGEGKRLMPLTADRAKPAVPFDAAQDRLRERRKTLRPALSAPSVNKQSPASAGVFLPAGSPAD